MRSTTLLVSVLLFLLSVNSFAADKVVVIPLNTCITNDSNVDVDCPCADEWRNFDMLPKNYEGGMLCKFVDYSGEGVYQKSIWMQFGDPEVEYAPSLSASITLQDEDDDDFQCVSNWSHLNDWGTIGGVSFYNIYPTQPIKFEQMQQAFFNACWQEIIDIATENNVTCQVQ